MALRSWGWLLPDETGDDDVMNLESDPQRSSELCREAHTRLLDRVSDVTDVVARSASRLPGWTVGHVITHLARNADAHTRRLTGALRAEDVPKYGSGEEQRRAEIDKGAGRSADGMISDLAASVSNIERAFDLCEAAGWPNGHFLGGGTYGVDGCAAHRLREVEMHHVDLGLGYTPFDWPDEYVAWDLSVLIASIPERLEPADARRTFMAWLAGRGPLPDTPPLTPW
jgi:maleylpyruvate isomerase